MEYQIKLNGKIYSISKNLSYSAGCVAGLRTLYENDKISNTSSYKNIVELSPELEDFFVGFCYLRSDELLNRDEMDYISFKVLDGRTGIRVKGNGVYHLYQYDSVSFLRGLLNTIFEFDQYYLAYLIPNIYANNKLYYIVRSQLSFTSNTYLTSGNVVNTSNLEIDDDESAPRRIGALITEKIDDGWVGYEDIVAVNNS